MSSGLKVTLSLVTILGFFTSNDFAQAAYQIGIGIADCTGPSVQIGFMGYAKIDQWGCGIHLRQFSRSYIFDDGETRVAFVTVDAQGINHGLRIEILRRLSELYGNTYNENNVIISGTHTHGTPGGYMMDLMFDFTIFGFVRETFDAYAEGITKSIIRAHENVVEAKIYLTSGELLDANINRSPASYLLNPEEERAKYEHDVDKELVQLKFVRTSDNVTIGAINWFAVHPTSMNNSNCLVTSDNVGYASIQLESDLNNGALPGKGSFVGAFASSNLGDVSPNTKGAICIDTGEPCDFVHSTCNGSAQFCIASGPGRDMYESTEIIAGKLYGKAKELLLQEEAHEVTGSIRFVHQYVDMPKTRINVTMVNGTVAEVQGCLPAMGYGFAGGTTDGPGLFDFSQGALTDNPFWNAVRDLVFPPTPEQIACQYPKPILIDTGVIEFPYSWQPQIVSTQLLKIGDVILAAVPGEFTTMSGRRLRDVIRDTVITNGGSAEHTKAIIAGLSNVYTNYIATPEEYQLQRYEGASTIYGPYTLDIYLQKYAELAASLTGGETLEPGPIPEDFSDKLITLIVPVLFDLAAENHTFGDCILEPPATISAGETVTVKFISGNPRNNLLQEDSYFVIERLNETTLEWDIVANDACWETRFKWEQINAILEESQVTIEWDIKEDAEQGIHRIRHKGHYKLISEVIVPYNGTSDVFYVINENRKY